MNINNISQFIKYELWSVHLEYLHKSGMTEAKLFCFSEHVQEGCVDYENIKIFIIVGIVIMKNVYAF